MHITHTKVIGEYIKILLNSKYLAKHIVSLLLSTVIELKAKLSCCRKMHILKILLEFPLINKQSTNVWIANILSVSLCLIG